MTDPTKSNYWLDVAADEIIRRFPDGEIVVSSGISPSASYHFGHFREIITAEALTWAIRQRGRESKHIHVVDNFDPLRKWYDFLPPTDNDYSGQPIALVPDPIGDCHPSYADHFYSEFAAALPPMAIQPEILKSYEDLYKPGRMNDYIDQTLASTEEIKEIFKRFKRELPKDWSPVSVLDENGRFTRGDLATWDKDKQTLNGRSYLDGHGKLDWRLDWPARWKELGVNVEPFGAQEHGASGGSYDTGAVFARQIFGVEPPYGDIRYGHIHLPGDNIKMSSSKGNLITAADALKIAPAEVLRYFIVRSRPERKIFFDQNMGLANLIDEFAAAQTDSDHEFVDAYKFAVSGNVDNVISSIPFKHIVQVYQAANFDADKTIEIINRGDHPLANKAEEKVLLRELKFVKNWLDKYAPEEAKFTVQASLPAVELSDAQIVFLSDLAARIEGETGETDGQKMHELIYEAKDTAELSPKDSFQALYRIILGKDYGPKAGWFLASLDRDFLVKRLRKQA